MDLVAINKMREMQGKEPLTELPTETPPAPPINTNTPPTPPNTEEPLVIVAELSDDQLLEALRKKGLQVTSFDDLKPKEDPALLAEQRDAAVLSYGLTKGKFNKKEYESLVRDSNDPQNLVYQDYHAAAKKEDPELSDEDIQAEFADKFGITAEPGTRKHKRGQQELSILADKLLKSKYQKIYDTENEYGQFESTQKQQLQTRQKIESAAPKYKADVDTVFNDLKKITVQFDEHETYEVDAMEDSLQSIKTLMIDPDFASEQILKGTTVAELKEIAYTKFLRDNFPILAKKIAIQHQYKNQKGAKGIIPLGVIAKDEAPILTAEQKIFVDMVKPQQAVAN